MKPQPGQFKQHRQSGLTLIEILVSSALLLFITLGLTMMFNQTQKAFRGGMRQSDIVESGRTAMELIAHDLQQMVEVGALDVTNFYMRTVPSLEFIQQHNGVDFRTNRLYDIFFVARENRDWMGIGYAVDGQVAGIGSLKRYQTNCTDEFLTDDNKLFYSYIYELNRLSTTTNFVRVMDGVIHLQINPIDEQGNVIYADVLTYPIDNGVNRTYLPAALEIELGILEPQILEQVKGLPDTPVNIREDFLRERAGKVHLFRQQIPIRTARK